MRNVKEGDERGRKMGRNILNITLLFLCFTSFKISKFKEKVTFRNHATSNVDKKWWTLFANDLFIITILKSGNFDEQFL